MQIPSDSSLCTSFISLSIRTQYLRPRLASPYPELKKSLKKIA
jgi:hypothetical protein